MKDKILAFFKAISPEAYHIEDAAYILGIKGSEELEAFMGDVEALTEAGLLEARPGDYYKFIDKAEKTVFIRAFVTAAGLLLTRRGNMK